MFKWLLFLALVVVGGLFAFVTLVKIPAPNKVIVHVVPEENLKGSLGNTTGETLSEPVGIKRRDEKIG